MERGRQVTLIAVRNNSTARALVVLACVGLLLFLALSGSHAQWAALVPFLIFFSLSLLTVLLRENGLVQCQPIAFLSFDTSRAPPRA